MDDDYVKAGISFDSEKDLEYGVGIDRNILPGNCIKMAGRQCWPAIGKFGTLPQKGQMLGKELIAKDEQDASNSKPINLEHRVPASCTLSTIGNRASKLLPTGE